MRRTTFTVLIALLTGTSWLTPIAAQSGFPLPPAPTPQGVRVGQAVTRNASHPTWHLPGRNASPQPAIKGYPHFSGPLYPSPRQDIPAQVGGTMITNQAFAPHEMLYPHQYRSMYGPFYYRVKGNWIWTPFGMESHDKWELMGTEVKVKYRPTFSLGSLFIPPR
ncbi:MAG: hypothetical protein O3B13_08485 [Planctomycetota bacterium]|nr:hypothetical protein [Planctomycetota bacterium]MDA1163123.1 hypothetical protein [Planctomycetota bacterium]